MKCFIGYESALEFWRSPLASALPQPSRALPSPKSRLDREAFESIDFESIGIAQKPIHLVVADLCSRTHSGFAVFHVLSAGMPSGSFAKVGEEAFVSSPGLLFLHMSRTCPLIELILLGYELCGAYALDRTDPRGFRARKAITSAAALRRFVERAGSVHGAKRARRALGFIVDGSESPMESIQAMLLFLPCSLGGHGVERAELNGLVSIQTAGKPSHKERRYRCDMVWRAHRLVVEYDSNLYHTGADRIAKDSKRRTDLIAAGYTVVTVTNDQIFNAREFEKIADLLIRRTGKKVRRAPYNVLTRRYQLRQTLFSTIARPESIERDDADTETEST